MGTVNLNNDRDGPGEATRCRVCACTDHLFVNPRTDVAYTRLNMDGSTPGEAGVLAWCNSIRLSIAEDDGREQLDTQIQKHGFDFLDSYLESVFSRPKEECVSHWSAARRDTQPVIRSDVYELLKTPGRKKTAPKKTRAATASTSKAKAVSRSFHEVRVQLTLLGGPN